MKKRKIFIFTLHVLMTTQTYFFLPLIPIYAKEFGITQFLIGQIIFFYNLPSGFTKIYIGFLIDKIGSKNVLIFSNLIFIIGLIFYFFPRNFFILCTAQFLTGTSRAAFMASTAFYFSEMDADERGKNLGIRTAGIGMGFFIGPILGGFVSDLWGYYSLFIILLMSFFLNALLLKNLPNIEVKKKKTKPAEDNNFIDETKLLLKNPEYLIVILSGFTISSIMILTDNYLPLYLNEISLSLKAVGFILSVKGLSQIIFGSIMGSLSDKYGRMIFVYGGITIPALSIMLLPFLTNFYFLVLNVFLISLGFTVLNPILNALAAETVSPERRGFSIGIWQSSVSFATTTFALLFGYMYSAFKLNYIFVVSSLFLLLCLIGVIFLRYKFVLSGKTKLKEVNSYDQ
ncbi:major facilitator superfamily MFS_1 [Halanaerobium saccharolyticum subsp. saccharolyticum DSM 6643]|uniref:Major facilitator superfamily MFS_1 n=2 Tax=Halanaerobium saccharolyticum TaxID=43595 RepID=M5DZ57_9FIRM|nr:major facilitator superfamily MFS_1 [Halanaerobium saccharolyticum subsp. saccharolyticum DSM 6643]